MPAESWPYMRVLFGRTLDNGAYPSVLDGSDSSAGKAHAGPAGLLALLEEALGIPTPQTQQPVRVAEFARRLFRHDDGKQFYSASRAADPWRVARKLLFLRDELMLSGWDGKLPAGGSSRLKAFAELEGLSKDQTLSPGVPERLLTVLERLQLLPSGIERVELIDERACFPKLWRDILEKLSAAGTGVVELPEEPAQATGDLDKAQRALRGETATDVEGDGSFYRLEVRGVYEAAEATCAYLSALLKSTTPDSIVLVRDGDSRAALILESTMRAFNLPSVGLSLESSHRPATQILPLFLGLAWEPVDPDLLVEFLTLPSSPIPAEARGRLRRALNEAPGYGSQAWRKARERSIEEIRSKFGEDRALDSERTMKDWLDDVQRTPLKEKIAKERAIRLTRQVESWANRRAHAEGKVDPFFTQAAEQATVMLSLLALHPEDSISRTELGRLLFDVLQTTIAYDLSSKETSSIRVVSHPASMFGAVPTIIWWQCVASSAEVPEPLFWTEEEVRSVEKAGCSLPVPTTLLLNYARGWRRPIVHAKERFLLIQPQQAFGEPQESHPIWNEVTAGIARDQVAQLTVSVDVTKILEGRISGLPDTPPRVKAKREELPRPQESWTLPARHLAPRATESPTSLEALLGCPLRWLLQYKAGIHEPLIQVLLERQLLYGNFAHRLFGDYLTNFTGKDLPEPTTAADEIGREFDQRVGTEAATLVKPGMDRERAEVKETLVRAMQSLIGLLGTGGFQIDSIERSHSGEFSPGTLEGRTDLMVRRTSDGLKAVIDMKWSKEGPKVEGLRNGTAVQLAAYSYLTGDGKAWPPTAYFLFTTGQLYSTRANEFPGCVRVSGPSDDQVWPAAVSATKEIRKLLDQGQVGVPCVAPEKAADSDFKLDPPCKTCEFQLFCRYLP